MFKKITLSILFTTNTIHKVTAGQKKYGESCAGRLDWCESPFHCHTISMNGSYVTNKYHKKDLKQRICVSEENPGKERRNQPCLSDHECNWPRRKQCDKYMVKPSGDPTWVCASVSIDGKEWEPSMGGRCTQQHYPGYQPTPNDEKTPKDNSPKVDIDPTMDSLSKTIRVLPGPYKKDPDNVPFGDEKKERDHGEMTEAPDQSSSPSPSPPPSPRPSPPPSPPANNPFGDSDETDHNTSR